MKYNKTELKFKELHNELLNLELFKLASELSEVFHNNGHENYKEGINMVKEVYKLNN